jgi:hypothetical protein
MTEDARKARNVERLGLCYPPFAGRVAALISRLEQEGFRPRIDQSWRTAAQHQQQVASGTSKSSWSFHMATTPDGKPDALAVDLLDDDYPVPANHQADWPDRFRQYVLWLAALSAQWGLETGVSWGLSVDERRALSDAMANDPLSYHGELGWDVCHVEIRDLTLAAAKAGKRPWV